MEKISFTKMSGAGNDFIVIDKNINPEFVFTDTIVSNLCNRRNGIGADGILAIENSPELDFSMSYFNADGSHGSLCGNGARCAILFAGLSGRIKNGKTIFSSNNIKYSGEILSEDRVRFNFNSPSDFRFNFEIETADSRMNASYVNTGSPHVVVNLNEIQKTGNGSQSKFGDLNELPVVKLGREIRNKKEFNPGGTNVNFIRVADNSLYIRTYERGVEDETLACGTGSVASAIIGYLKYNIQPPVKLHTFGGDDLIVDFIADGKEINNLTLTGPVKITYTGEFLLNKFL